MRSFSISKYNSVIVITLLIILKASVSFSQSDSIKYWQNAILKAPTLTSAKKAGIEVQSYFARRNDPNFMADVDIIFDAAVKSEFSKDLFNQLFLYLDEYSKNNNKEIEFTVFALKLENNHDYQNQDIQYQLYYFYSVLYFHLKEYFYAEKYCSKFLKYGQNAFPEYIRASNYLNAMTILALIDSEKKDFTGAMKKFKTTLDSSIAKKNEAWVGITKGNIAYILYQEGNYNESINFLKEDIKLSLKYNEWGSAMISYLTLKDVYLKLNQPEKSSLYLDSAHLLLNKIVSDNPFNERYYLNEEFDIHISEGNRLYKNHDYVNASKLYAKAFELQKLKDQKEKDIQIKKIIEGNEIDRNLNQINELKEEIQIKKNVLFYLSTVVIAFCCVILIFIIFYLKLNKANKSLTIKTEIINQQNLVLEKINNDKDRLFSIISHDLRGPSNNLHSIFKAVADKRLPASTLEEQLPSIVKNSTNLINTLESLLTWSVSQLKGIIAYKEKIDIIDSINTNIHFFEDQAQKKSIKLINHCHSKMVLIDKNHLEIILRNFTSNAIKFSKPNATIQFDQIEHTDFVEILVVDEGTGITDEQINNIMNSNAQKSVVGTSGEKGIGLGLLLTKEFIEINGGVLKIKSQLNEGTTMSFTIPKAS
jgi:signal transduction histidine kinase